MNGQRQMETIVKTQPSVEDTRLDEEEEENAYKIEQ